MLKTIYSGVEKVHAALVVYDVPQNKIDKILSEQTDEYWDTFTEKCKKHAIKMGHGNPAGVIVGTLHMDTWIAKMNESK